MPDIFDEVEEDLRAERARAFGRRFAGAGIASLVLILLGTGAAVYWQQRRAGAADAVADRFITAAHQADHATAASGAPDAANATPAAEALASIAQGGPAGYRVLARLRLAALQWQTGRHPEALATWQSISDDASVPDLMRDLATVTSAQHQIDSADPIPLKQRLQALTGQANPWRPMAQQLVALLDVRMGQPREAAALLQHLTTDAMTPEDMRQMAADLLTTLPADAVAAAQKPALPPAAPVAAVHG